jgi:hypothetical protein
MLLENDLVAARALISLKRLAEAEQVMMSLRLLLERTPELRQT